MEIQENPPPVEVLSKALRPVVSRGLPIPPSFEDEALLGLRGVVARSVDPGDRLSRIKALDELLKRLLVHFPDDERGEAARILFGIAPGSRGKNLTARRRQISELAGYDVDHFRRRIEPRIIEVLAWELHRDSQNYMPRSRSLPPPVEASGDTPTITAGDLVSKDAAEHQELLSLLWAHVYALRAQIIRAERLKAWPFDPSEPTTSDTKLKEAIAARDREVKAVQTLLQRYVKRYGNRVNQSEAEFNAQAMLSLAGWRPDL